MLPFLIVITVLLSAALGLHLYKRAMRLREQRISENEYNTAVALWEFARTFRSYVMEASRQNPGVLDSSRMVLPHAKGYRLLFELAGTSFKVLGVPEKYERSGRLSFFIDNSLTLRAANHAGERATEQDPEYEG